MQRKLAVAPVPKPPAGLAERIKSQIPKELRFNADRERDRFGHSVRFSIAVAASVVVVIASAFVVLRVTETTGPRQEIRAIRNAPVPPPIAAPAAAPPLAATQPQEAVKKQNEIAKTLDHPLELARRDEMRPLEKDKKKEEVAATAQVASKPAATGGIAREAETANVASAPSAPAVAQFDAVAAKAAPAAARSAVENKIEPPPNWRDLTRDEKIKFLKDKLAHGADPKQIVNMAREAGLDEFADEIEKKKP
ncbi:MAG TPA: hypothetical protein VL284_19810 [Thermoanaerobaculia bacterium]|nr:hypothetical protein [Thermoanaerobaculia bacterium]